MNGRAGLAVNGRAGLATRRTNLLNVGLDLREEVYEFNIGREQDVFSGVTAQVEHRVKQSELDYRPGTIR